MLIKVNVESIFIDPVTKDPVLILRSGDGEFTVPVWIAMTEAFSISAAVRNVSFERPMTHDLFKNFMVKLGMTVTSAEITDMTGSTYYGKIHFKAGDKNLSIDSRPSDAVALALRFKAPIYIEKKVFAKSEIVNFESEAMDMSDQGKQWAEYLEKLSMDDFGKYIT